MESNSSHGLSHRTSTYGQSSENGAVSSSYAGSYGSPSQTAKASYGTPTSAASPYYMYAPTSPPAAAAAVPVSSSPTTASSKKNDDPQTNGHEKETDIMTNVVSLNTTIAAFWIPSIILIGFLRSDTWVMLSQSAAFLGLLVYGLDLANLRRMASIAVWIACLTESFLMLHLHSGDVHASRIAASGPIALCIMCTAFWVALQNEWLPATRRAKIQTCLLGVLPPVAASLAAAVCLTTVGGGLAPYVYIAILTVGMYSSPAPPMGLHTILLVIVPGLMQGTLSIGHASLHDLDILLAFTVPWLARWTVVTTSPAVFFPSLVLTAGAVQQRYLVPFFQRHAYRIAGTHVSHLELTLYWTLGMGALVVAIWLWQHAASKPQHQRIGGDYHDDMVQLCLAMAGIGIGKGMGLSWSMTPLPVLGLLGFSLWVTTRMLRYLAIVLFVAHATAVVVFTYRFVGMNDQTIAVPIMGTSVSLTRFGMLVTIVSVLWLGSIMGLAVRSSGGFMNSTLRKFDVAGGMLVVYAFLLMVVEITLLHRERPLKELVGVVEDSMAEGVVDETLYHTNLVFLTSVALIALSLFMRHIRILKAWSSSLTIALALGKSVGTFCYAFGNLSSKAATSQHAQHMFLYNVSAAMLCTILFAPGAFLRPVYVKRSRRGTSDLPAKATRAVVGYCLVVVPISLLAASPAVVIPLVKALLKSFQRDLYYNSSNPLVEYLGVATSLWGLSCLTMLQQYLPDGGGEAWKKLSGLAFLTGVGLLAIAPSLGLGSTDNPYASISSLGMQLVQRSKSRTGGWGILSAALATLFAATGPLQLKERRTGRKDRFVLFRTMVFGLLFGGGIAWFITLVNMNQTGWFSLTITLLSTLTLAFIGTVASVLGYSVELENIDEAAQIAKTWALAFVALLPISGLPQLLPSSSTRTFGVGGWLSTYLAVAGVFSIIFCLAVSRRNSKSVDTRGMSNFGCIVGWACCIAVVYGRYGVGDPASVDTIPTGLLSVPASIGLTLVLAPLLLLLEGEKMIGRTRRTAIPSSNHRGGGAASPGIVLSNLSEENRWFPVFLGIVLPFVGASMFAVLLRGSGKLFTFTTEKKLMKGFAKQPSIGYDIGMIGKLAAAVASTGLESSMYSGMDRAGFWSSPSPVVLIPFLHLSGIALLTPCLYHVTRRYFWNRVVNISTASVVLAGSPLLFCYNIPCLQAAALLTSGCGASLLMEQRRIEKDTRMRI